MKIIVIGSAGPIGSEAAPSSPSPEAQVALETAEVCELGDGHLSDPAGIEQDALPVDGEAATHLDPECALVDRGLVQG